MISWITENVAIGEFLDINQELLEKEKIDCILNLRLSVSTREDVVRQVLGIAYYHVSVGREQGLEPIKIELKVASYMLGLLAEKYNRILVHCTAGMDRSPFVVALYLTRLNADVSRATKLDTTDLKFWLDKAYNFIKEKRPQIIKHMEWV